MSAVLGAAALGTAAKTAGGIVTGMFNNALAEKSADRQYERQLDFWNKQNLYNTPEEQRKRLESAGLNSAAVMSEGVENQAGGLSNVPGNQYAQSGVIKQAELGNFADTLVKFAQAANLNANTEKQGAETDLISSQAEYQDLQNNIERTYQDLVKTEMGGKQVPLDVLARKYEAYKKMSDADKSDYESQLKGFEARAAGYLYDNMYHDLVLQSKKNEVSASEEELKKLAAASTFAFTKEMGDALGKFAPVGELLLNIFKVWLLTKK